jgi:uncharacterized coiled-coil protein SlyX
MNRNEPLQQTTNNRVEIGKPILHENNMPWDDRVKNKTSQVGWAVSQTIIGLRAAIRDREGKSTILQSQLDAANKQITRQISYIKTIEAKLSERNSEIKKLIAAVADKDEEIERRIASISSLCEENAKLKEQQTEQQSQPGFPQWWEYTRTPDGYAHYYEFATADAVSTAYTIHGEEMASVHWTLWDMDEDNYRRIPGMPEVVRIVKKASEFRWYQAKCGTVYRCGLNVDAWFGKTSSNRCLLDEWQCRQYCKPLTPAEAVRILTERGRDPLWGLT